MFIKYQHLERLGTDEVDGILDGEVYIFPKIDGTNASVWWDGKKVCYGSRNRELSLENDNAGFMTWAVTSPELQDYFKRYPDYRLFGEWLVPHSLKTYQPEAWRKFYVFDVGVPNERGEYDYCHYNDYSDILKMTGIEYIPPLAIIRNPNEENIIPILKKNFYLIEDGKGVGEGIVLKNYDFVNKYHRTTWAKIVTNEFKAKHHQEMGAPIINNTLLDEERIIDKYVTEAFVRKEKAKIEQEHNGDWNSKMIPELLGRVWHELIREESWNFVKEFKNPKINFKFMHGLCISKTKKVIGI